MEDPVTTPSTLRLFVPHPESSLCTQLAHGSAIVGQPQGQDSIRIYYEGNLIGAENLRRYRDRAIQAGNRLLYKYPAGYPTIAKAEVDPREVIEIGTLQPATGTLEITARAEELSWWIDVSDLQDLGIIRPPR